MATSERGKAHWRIASKRSYDKPKPKKDEVKRKQQHINKLIIKTKLHGWCSCGEGLKEVQKIVQQCNKLETDCIKEWFADVLFICLFAKKVRLHPLPMECTQDANGTHTRPLGAQVHRLPCTPITECHTQHGCTGLTMRGQLCSMHVTHNPEPANLLDRCPGGAICWFLQQ